MKKLFLLPILFVFQIAFSQQDQTISFLYPECMDEVMSGFQKMIFTSIGHFFK